MQTVGRLFFFVYLLNVFNIRLEKFKGDGTRDIMTWFTRFVQWTKLYDLPELKVFDALSFTSIYIFRRTCLI